MSCGVCGSFQFSELYVRRTAPLTGRARCLSGTGTLLQEEPGSTRAAREHQRGPGKPHWVQTVLLNAELSAGGNCREGWAGNLRMLVNSEGFSELYVLNVLFI